MCYFYFALLFLCPANCALAQVIVVGTDSSEQECASMFNELSLHGFLAIPPKDITRRKILQMRWDAVAPAVVILELHENGGKELVRDARTMIEADPHAEVRAHAIT